MVSTFPKTVNEELLEEGDLKISLEEYLYDLLVLNGPKTRGEIVKLTKLPRTTIYDYLIKLILKDKVVRFSRSGRKPGRPKVYFKAIVIE